MTFSIRKNDQTIASFDDWARHAPPKGREAQWVVKRSAMECARAWTVPDVHVPQDIERALHSHPDLRDCRIETVFPEHRIPFDKLGEPRNADLAVIGADAEGTIAITIEAKADESFDRLFTGVQKAADKRLANDLATNAPERLHSLIRAILPTGTKRDEVSALRYQLLTGIAGSLAFAAEIGAARAVFLVHEFESDETDARKLERNARDFDAFVTRLAPSLAKGATDGQLIGPIRVTGGLNFLKPAVLYVGKVRTKLA